MISGPRATRSPWPKRRGACRGPPCRARAQLAIASGDLQAATAILVAAIEEDPQNTTLRAQLTEALLAGGNAGHARDVLARIGMRPADPAKGRGGAEGG